MKAGSMRVREYRTWVMKTNAMREMTMPARAMKVGYMVAIQYGKV